MDKSRKKKYVWTIQNESLLIKLWRERVHDLRNTRRSAKIYEDIRDKLERKGCFVEVIEIKHKVHNLSSKYRKEKQKRACGYSPLDWEFYDILDDMLSTYQPGNVITVDDVDENSTSCNDDVSAHEDVPRKTRYRQPQYANENFFSNDEEENEDENEQEETANEPISYRRQTENHNEGRNEYLKAMSENLKLMVEKVYELSENIQSWEEKGNSQLVQISQILRNQQRTKYEDPANDTSLSSSRKRKLSQYDPDAGDEISKFENLLPPDEIDENEKSMSAVKLYALKRNKTILDDYLKTKELERKFMTEKHNIQMEILRLELETKRNEMEMDD